MTADVEVTPMSRAEREELKALARQRARVAKAGIELRQAELLADAEAQLCAIYAWNDEAWADLADEAKRMVEALDAQLAARCRELGIQADFRPRIEASWYGRGVNGDKNRRAELRKAAERRVDAEGRAAKVAIDQASLEVLTELTAGGLTSFDARGFLTSMPSVVELMPSLDVRQLDAGT